MLLLTLVLFLIGIYISEKDLKLYKIEFKYKYLIYPLSLIWIALSYKNLNELKYFIIPIIPILFANFIIDVKTQNIANLSVIFISANGLFYLIFLFLHDGMTIQSILGHISLSFIITIIYLILSLLSLMGMGDVKLIGGLALFFSFSTTILFQLIIKPFYLGGILGILVLLKYYLYDNKKDSSKEKPKYIPFGPAIIIAFLLMI